MVMAQIQGLRQKATIYIYIYFCYLVINLYVFKNNI